MVVESGLFDLLFKPLADHVQLALEPLGIADRAAAADEAVPHDRLDLPGTLSQRPGVGLDAPPSQEVLPFLRDEPLEELHAKLLLRLFGSREERPHAVLFGLGQLDQKRPAARDEKLMRDLDQQARAIAGVVLTAAGAAMVEIGKRGQAVADE